MRLLLLSFILTSCGNLGYQRVETNHRVGGSASVNSNVKVELAIDEASRKLCIDFKTDVKKLECIRLMTEAFAAVATSIKGE